MRRFQRFQFAAAGLAALGLVLPAGVTLAADGNWPAARPTPATSTGQASPGQTPPIGVGPQVPAVLDVSLGNGGVLAGQVVDAQGRPIAQTPVMLRSAAGQMATTGTDGNGRFQLAGLPGGLYEVNAAGRTGTFRLWANHASPPGAVRQVMLVAGQPVTRGQMPSVQSPPRGSGARQGGKYFGGQGAFWGGVIILGSLGGIVAGGIITGEQGNSS